jgi:translation initiation factor IF-1
LRVAKTEVWGWFCCVSNVRSGVPAQDQPVPFLDEQASGPDPWKAISVPRTFTMTQDKTIEIEGTITSVLPGTMFHVALANNHTVLAHISGKMRKRFIRLLNGDRVKLEMSPYDLEKARIVYRLG